MFASELASQVRLMGSITPDVSDADIFSHADMEVQSRLLPFVRNLNEDYLVRVVDVVADGGRVALPARAAGASLRLVQLVTGGQLYTLPRIDPGLDTGLPTNGQPYGFYFDGGGIVLLPLGASGTVRLRYYARPGKLALETDGNLFKAISSVTPGPVTTTIVCGGYVGSTSIDIISSGPAHQLKAIGTTLTGSTTLPTVDLLEPLVGGNATILGDFVCFPDKTPYVPLPEELASVLVSRTAARILFALGYRDEATAQIQIAEVMQSEAELLLRPRDSGNPKRLSGGMLSRMGTVRDDSWRRY